MSDEDINNSNISSPTNRGYTSLESCNSNDLSSNNSDFDNYVEMHQETLSTQQLILSSDTDDGLEEHLNIGDLHILENSDLLEAAGDCAMVEEARGIRQEHNNPPQFPIPSEVPSESSGYLGSNESSVDSTTERDDESMLGINRRITFPLPIRNCSSIASTVTESSIHSEDNVDIHRYMRSIIESAVHNSVNKSKPEHKRKKLTKHLNQTSGSDPASSESDDSFFSSEKLSSNFSSDNSHLYKMTMSVRYPDELILKKSKSLDSFIHRPCKPQHYLRKELINGDNVHSDIDQRQFLKNEIKKFFKKDREDDSRNLLSNLDALYPNDIQNVNFNAYVNTTNYFSANCKSDKLLRTSRNKDNEEKDCATNNFQSVNVKKVTPLVQNEDIHFEAFETLKWDTLNTCDPPIIDQLTNLYSIPSDSKLIRKPPVCDDVFPGNDKNEVSGSADYILAKHIRNRIALQEKMADQGSKKSGLKYANNSSYKEKKDMSSLFYVGETKGYSTESDEYDKSEIGNEDDHYKHDATLGDENNNYVLSQTSSDDSLECETSSKFQFTKDISRREECLRQSLVAVDFERDDADKFKNNDDTPKRRVSFNNNYPVHIPSLRSYLKNRHDYSMEDELGKFPSISTMDAASSTDFLSSTDEEFVKIRTELAGQVKVINDAQKGSFQLLCDLQGLWMNVGDIQSGSCNLPNTNSGEHTLLQQIHLCSFITDQMNQDWRAFMSANPIDLKKLHKLQHANKFLKEQLDSCRIIQSCLESEINYAAKEKALLNDEVKHLSYKLATRACKLERTSPFSPVSPNTEVYYQRTSILKNQEDVQPGIVSLHPIPKNNGNIVLPSVTLNNSNNASVSTPNQELEQAERNFVKQREDDFESIMDCVRDRKCVMDTLNSQLDKYQEDVQALEQQIETTNLDKEQVLSSYETLIEEKKVLIRERDKYESLLKTLLKEKANSEFSLQDLLQNVMAKLNLMTNEKEEKTSRSSMIESAMQTVQNQNLTYREEIIQLKEKLAFELDHGLCLKLELEDSLTIADNSIKELKQIIAHKDEIQRSQEERLSTLEDLQNAVTHVKSDLDNAVAEKDDEIVKLKTNLEEIHSLNIKQQRKIHDLQKVNSKLTRETKEHRRSIEQLGTIINQLRQSISNQKAQYTERVESASEEVVQSKEHCRWLQLQVDHLNVQLSDAHERIKVHEKDKTALAQQVLSAEEERKVVDRKLTELKSALQSDTVLRQALIERNEALQTEIHRLRRVKLASLSPVSERMPNLEGEFANPPSDFSTTEGLLSLNSFPLPEHKPMPIGERRKNRYPSAHRKATDPTTPRTAVSLHNATGLNCHESTHLDVDLNAGGAAAAATNE